jgi:predicted amidohydrolase YtcJ
VGKLGDFVVLAEDPFAVDLGHIKDIPIDMTVIGGEAVYGSV